MKRLVLDIVLLPILCLIALLSRLKKKPFDIGLGPEPLINNIYHKKALELYGYSSQTFVIDTYFITSNFDVNLSEEAPKFFHRFNWYYAFAYSVFKYKCLYIYFNGGPLFGTSRLLRALEPYLLKLSGVKVVVMPYGGDVSDCSTNPNLLFKYGLISHYPDYSKSVKKVQDQVHRWTRHANYIFSGCDWVDYTYFWNKLMLAHFSIDTEEWSPDYNYKQDETFRILHAPNHRLIKGSESLFNAVEKMKSQGKKVELILLEKKPNAEVKKLIKGVDLVVDQLIIGWYAMFALEGMSSGKPVVCFIREDLKKLYEYAGLLEDPLPLISASPDTIFQCLTELYDKRELLTEKGKESREFVLKYHSLKKVGQFFDEANKSIGLR